MWKGDRLRFNGIILTSLYLRQAFYILILNFNVVFLFLKHLTFQREFDSDSLRHYSWAADTLDNVNLVSSPIHSG